MSSTTRSSKRRKTEERRPRLRLLPQVVDELAANHPDQTWISIPKTNDPTSGFNDITYQQLKNAVNAATIWLKGSLPADLNLTLPYLGPSDTRYIILTVAAIKLGHNLFLISPRNDDQTQLQLLKAASCKRILCASTDADYAGSVISQSDLALQPHSLLVVPEEAVLLRAPSTEISYQQSFEDVRQHTALTIHTSGSSGPIPKIVRLTHGYLAHEDTLAHFPPPLPLTYTLCDAFMVSRCIMQAVCCSVSSKVCFSGQCGSCRLPERS